MKAIQNGKKMFCISANNFYVFLSDNYLSSLIFS